MIKYYVEEMQRRYGYELNIAQFHSISITLDIIFKLSVHSYAQGFKARTSHTHILMTLFVSENSERIYAFLHLLEPASPDACWEIGTVFYLQNFTSFWFLWVYILFGNSYSGHCFHCSIGPSTRFTTSYDTFVNSSLIMYEVYRICNAVYINIKMY